MRKVAKATLLAAIVALVAAAPAAAKGQVSATIDPGDPQSAQPADVTVTVTSEGQTLDDMTGVFVEFVNASTRERVAVPATFVSAGRYTAQVTLLREGRWFAHAGIRFGSEVSFFEPTYGGDSMQLVVVAPAPEAPAVNLWAQGILIIALAAVVFGASGIGARRLRRHRGVITADGIGEPAPVGALRKAGA